MRQRVVKPMIKTDNVAFQTSESYDGNSYQGEQPEFVAAYNAYRPKSNRPLCTHCGKLGHTLQTCFQVHGYPPGYKIPGQGNTQGNKASYNPRGQTDFNSKPVFRPQANNMPEQRTVANVFTGQLPASDTVPYYPSPAMNAVNLDVSRLTQEQAQTLISQLSSHAQVPVSESLTPQFPTITEHGIMAVQSSSGTVFNISSNLRYENNNLTYNHQCLSSLHTALPNDAWIIDSGATSHVCCDFSKFKETSLVSGITVALPNGISLPITHTCTIHLSDSLVLHNALFVPSFRFNLISVSTLLRDNKCFAHFYPTSCFLQECSRGWMIGSANLHHNLYILNLQSLNTPVASSSVINFCGSLSADGNLWHQRLGHPSTAKLELLSDCLSLNKSALASPHHCSVCPLAKQKRLSFPFNNNVSSNPFDLVHLDIWGPFSVESIEGYKYFLTVVDDCTRVTWV